MKRTIDLKPLESFNEVFATRPFFDRQVRAKIGNKKHSEIIFQDFNQICTCILRIRETSNYLNQFKFREANACGQAFDFYEFVNCISIIHGCIETLFERFDMKIEDFVKGKRCFLRSNTTRANDIAFFKFIRSASSVHPSDTTKYPKIAKHKFESYPYAVWANTPTEELWPHPEGADIALCSWNCKSNGRTKRYYLFIDEFYSFVNSLISSVYHLNAPAENIIKNYIEKLRCKRLKREASFDSFPRYCLYLKGRLEKTMTNDIKHDGGLLLASHVISNPLISDSFKEYLKSQVRKLSVQMTVDVTLIDSDFVFSGLNLSSIIDDKVEKSGYICEKVETYLPREALSEIASGKYVVLPEKIECQENNTNYSDPEWALIQFSRVEYLVFPNGENKAAKTYTDLYELILQMIWEKGKKK